MDHTENELIAEFMGLERSREVWENGEHAYTMKWPSRVFNTWVIPSQMAFDTSWDWLMPVVYKLCDVISSHDQAFVGLVLFELGLTTPIEEVYKAVLEAIQYYNTTQPQAK